MPRLCSGGIDKVTNHKGTWEAYNNQHNEAINRRLAKPNQAYNPPQFLFYVTFFLPYVRKESLCNLLKLICIGLQSQELSPTFLSTFSLISSSV